MQTFMKIFNNTHNFNPVVKTHLSELKALS